MAFGAGPDRDFRPALMNRQIFNRNKASPCNIFGKFCTILKTNLSAYNGAHAIAAHQQSAVDGHAIPKMCLHAAFNFYEIREVMRCVNALRIVAHHRA